MATIGDGDYDFEYTYSILGNLTSTTQDLTGLTDDVEFTYAYDVLGRKTSVAAKVGATDDYVNTYSYDNLGRITQITQEGVSGGNAVAEKRVDFGYSDDFTRATISRFADLAGTKAVAETEKVFDELGRVTDIVHERAATEFADYDLTWDAASRITDIDFDFLGTAYDDEASYAYDDTSQLTDADYTTQADEDYVYDDNGNRTLVDGTDTYTTGDHNRLTSDGTYYYTYDNEGNRTGKYSDASHTTPVEKYFWDHRNRMTKTELYVSGELDTTVEYAYDHDNRMYSRIVDAASDSRQIFVRDNDQIVLEMADDNVGDVTGSDLSRRALWRPDTVDQLMAEEHIGDDTYWMLTDHLGTVRDIVAYESATDTTALEQHSEFSSFGVLLNTPTIESLALYTGRFYDYLMQKQYNRERWYDLSSGQWMSVDPIGFEAGDVNLYRYVGNAAILSTDPTGLVNWSGTSGSVSNKVKFTYSTDNEVFDKLGKSKISTWLNQNGFQRYVKVFFKYTTPCPKGYFAIHPGLHTTTKTKTTINKTLWVSITATGGAAQAQVYTSQAQALAAMQSLPKDTKWANGPQKVDITIEKTTKVKKSTGWCCPCPTFPNLF